MTDIDLATRLETISADLRNLVGDHLKLIAYADALKSEAANIRDPQAAKESEFEFQKAALVARGLDPKLHQPVPVEGEPVYIADPAIGEPVADETARDDALRSETPTEEYERRTGMNPVGEA